MAGNQDPWVEGLPVPGVQFPYNARVQIIGGEHDGEMGWLVRLDSRATDPIYTVELEDGGADAEVPQSALRLMQEDSG